MTEKKKKIATHRVRRLRRRKPAIPDAVQEAADPQVPPSSTPSGDSTGTSGSRFPTTKRKVGSTSTGTRSAVGPIADGDDPLVGSAIEGKYRILEPLGRGGMAKIYKAWHLMLEKEVAIKVILPNATTRDDFRARFFREARIASDLVHPNLLPTRDFGETPDGQFYMLMDYCPGRTLAAVLEEEGRLEPRRAVKILVQALKALGEVHRKSIIHRDMKSGNIMVDDEDFVRIIDFGLAKSLASSEPDQDLTEVGGVVGTARYMSPEQAMGEQCDHLTDIYSTGLVLYEMLCGKLPFQAETSTERVRKRIVDAPQRPSELVPDIDIPTELEAVLMKAVARERANRWQSADQFREGLEQFLSGDKVEVAAIASADTFEHRGGLALEGIDDSIRADRVRHKDLDREGVLWVIDSQDPDGDLAGLTAQLQVIRRVEHPALAPSDEVGAYTGGRLYAFTTWREGTPLKERLSGGPADVRELAEIARPILEGLSKAHDFGISHGAIQPALITLTHTGPVLHGLGVVPMAMRAQGRPSQDVWSLTQVLVRLLAGADRPYEAGFDHLPPALRDIFRQANNPGGYPDAATLLAALQRADPRFRDAEPEPDSPRFPLVAMLGLLMLIAAAAAYGARDVLLPKVKPQPSPVASAPAKTPASKTPAPAVTKPVQPSPTPTRAPNLGDPIPATLLEGVAAARAAAIKAGAERFGRVELVEADAAWARKKTLRGSAGVEEAKGAVARYAGLKLLAASRQRLTRLATEARGVEAAVRRMHKQAMAVDPSGSGSAIDLLKAAEALPRPKPLEVVAGKLDEAETQMQANLAGWERARAGYKRVLATTVADRQGAVETARAAAIKAGAEAVAASELAVADAAWAKGKGLGGAKGAAAARKGVVQFRAVERLARGRKELANLAAKIDASAKVVRGLKRQSRKNLADIYHRDDYELANKQMATAGAMNSVEVKPAEATLKTLDATRESLKRQLDAFETARTLFGKVAAESVESNAVRTLLSKFSAHLRRRERKLLLKLFADPAADRAFLSAYLAYARDVRFNHARAVITRKLAYAKITTFTYLDARKGERVSHRGMRVEMKKINGVWRVTNIRAAR